MPGLSTVSSLTDVVMSHSTESYPITLAGLSSVTHLISDSAQSHVIVTNSAVNPLQLPMFTLVTVTTESEQYWE